MLVGFLDNSNRWPKTAQAAALVAWVIVTYMVAQFVVALAMSALIGAGLLPFSTIILFFLAGALTYTLSLVAVLGPVVKLKGWRWAQIWQRLGVKRRPELLHVILAGLGLGAYLLVSYALTVLVMSLVPGFDAGQAQILGFDAAQNAFLAFFLLVIIAPFAEELFFRGVLFGGLRKRIPFVPAMLITSILFGLAHGQANVALDTFALSLLLCFLYEGSGSLWPAIFLHMLKNGVAFAFLLRASSLQ